MNKKEYERRMRSLLLEEQRLKNAKLQQEMIVMSAQIGLLFGQNTDEQPKE